MLALIPKKIAQLRRAGVDLLPFEETDVSGIAGTALSALFTYDITRWLAKHYPRAVEIDWDGYDVALLGPLLRRLHPFANEDLLVEANIPYMDWFRAAKHERGSDLRWLIARIEELPIPAADRAELFAQAKIFVRWELGDPRRLSHEWALARASQVLLSRRRADPPRRRVARGRTRITHARD